MSEDQNFFLVGGGARFNTCLPVFLESNVKLSAVFISKDEDYLSISKLLLKYKVNIIKKWSSLIDEVNNSSNPTVFFISYNKVIEPKDFLRARLVNYHASPLPKYRGGSPMNWAIINGEKEFGVSIHELVKSIDAGPILIQEHFFMSDFDYTQLVERVNKAYFRLTKIVLSTFDIFWEQRISQDEELVSYFHQRKPENSKISFLKMNSNTIINMYKALPAPLPRPFFQFNENKFAISSCKLPQRKYYGQPGRVIGNHENGIVVICLSGSIVIEKIIKIKDNTEHNAKEILQTGALVID